MMAGAPSRPLTRRRGRVRTFGDDWSLNHHLLINGKVPQQTPHQGHSDALQSRFTYFPLWGVQVALSQPPEPRVRARNQIPQATG